MMSLTDLQYERIARRIDGEAVSLTDDEQAAFDEITADEAVLADALHVSVDGCRTQLPPAATIVEIARHEAAIGAMLDVDVPAASMDRARRRIQAELARPRRRLLKVCGALAAAAAVAAVVLVMTLPGRVTSVQPAGPVNRPAGTGELALSDTPVPTDVYVASVQATQDPAIHLLAAEIDQLEADVIASSTPAPVDIGLDQAERAVEDFWLDDAALE